MELAVGTVINRTYELLEVLGRGGMGEVWRAGHLRLPKYVAIKVLTATQVDDDDIVARFRREAEITSRLGHPNIVQVMDFDNLPDGTAYIVMELLEGQNLRQRLAAGALAREEAIQILKQVASALYVAHQAGVVHRDLKPENIILTRGLEGLVAKIVDFGISKVQGSQSVVTRKSTVLGTPGYMSPEQARGEHKLIDARTDQFALATIAYELFSGKCAYSGETLAEVVFKVVFQQATPLQEIIPDLPDSIAKAIDRAMAKDPAKRFADVSSFIQSLSGTPLNIPTAKDLPAPAQLSGASDPALAATQISGSSLPALPATQQQDVGAVSTELNSGPADPIPPTLARMVQTKVGHSNPSLAPIPTQPAAQKSSKLPWVIVAVLLIASGAGAAILLTRDKPLGGAQPDSGLKNPVATVKDAAVAKKDAARQTIAKDAAPQTPDTKTKPAAPDTRKPSAGKKPSGKKPSGRPPRGKLPPEIAKKLKQASAALKRKDYRRALRLVDQTFAVRKTTAAWILRAKAFCVKRDLTNVNAALRNVPRRSRRAVKTYCRRIGMSID